VTATGTGLFMEDRGIARKLFTFTAFALVVVAANWTTNAFGLVHWFGIVVTAGTWFAGFGLVARDATQEAGGPRWVVAAIITGAVISAVFNPHLALASCTAFILSEAADYAVYQPLRRRGRTRAALASNILGAIVDSLVFLSIAGFPLTLIWAQVGIKVTVTSVFVLATHGISTVTRGRQAAA
jgi:queuosine precursor transporter